MVCTWKMPYPSLIKRIRVLNSAQRTSYCHLKLRKASAARRRGPGRSWLWAHPGKSAGGQMDLFRSELQDPVVDTVPLGNSNTLGLSLTDGLAFQLRDSGQDREHGLPLGRISIQRRVINEFQSDALGLEFFNESEKIRRGPRQTIW